MKKYKLIKEYPGSAELNSEYKEVSSLSVRGYINYGKKGSFLSARDVENKPEFWELMVEKEWEIMSFKQKSKIEDLWEAVDIINNKFSRKKGKVFCTTPYSLEEILDNPFYYINSVKRSSDDKVFTVGDSVTYGKNKFLIIESFHYIKGTVFIKYVDDRILYNNWLTSNFQHYTIPIFTTNDKVAIYKGDSYYLVNTKYFSIFSLICNEEDFKSSEVFVTFSTKEKAEEYVLYNSPVLSVNDVNNILDSSKSYQYHTTTIAELVKFLKAKK